MDATPGHRLAAARKAHGWSVEDVAHVTKIHAARIRDLENDDYAAFASTTYARNFLLLYAKHLGLDLGDSADRILPRGGPASLAGYEYLQEASKPARRDRDQGRELGREPGPRRSSALLFLLFVAFVAGLAWVGWRAFERLLDRIEPQPNPPAAAATPAPEPIPAPTPAAEPEPTPEPTPEAAPTPEPEVRRALPVSGTPPPPPTFAVELRARKRTWVKIITDNPAKPVLYEDWLGPASGPLKFEGSRFWIEMLDRNAVDIFRDGTKVSSPSTSVALE